MLIQLFIIIIILLFHTPTNHSGVGITVVGHKHIYRYIRCSLVAYIRTFVSCLCIITTIDIFMSLSNSKYWVNEKEAKQTSLHSNSVSKQQGRVDGHNCNIALSL